MACALWRGVSRFVAPWREAAGPLYHSGAVDSREQRLESWKEIASYLGRSPRTVQRWERLEGLPVHRLQHDKLGSVYAYASELDAWWEARRTQLGGPEPEDDDAPESPTAPAPADPIPAKRRSSLWLGALAIALAAVAGLLWKRAAPASQPAPKAVRLAVLPFSNFTGDPQQEFLSDGLTEEMIAELGRLPELGVIARTSVMRYKKTEKSIREIGQDLRVDYVLEGSVRQEQKRLRVTAQLIRVADEVHVWAESYDRETGDLIGVQRQIATRIAEETRLRTAVPDDRAVDPATYLAYLRGRFEWNKRTEDGFRAGLAQFQQASASDPTWARPWSGIADSYMLMGNYGFLPAQEAAPKAKEAAQKAIALDPDLAEAHASLGLVLASADWDFPTANAEFDRAHALNRSLATARLWHGLLLFDLGRVPEARTQFTLGLESDPLSDTLRGMLSDCDFVQGRIEQAIATEKASAEASPDRPNPWISLTRYYAESGRAPEAIAAAEKARALTHDHPSVMGLYAYVLAKAGRRADAQRVLDQLVKESAERHVRAFDLALAATGLGEKDRAIAWLEAMVAEHHVGARSLGNYAEFASLRSDPRFQALLVKVGLRPAARS